ncbi:TRAP-type C4-dicarboxylate transport system substrate-binding protein [Maritimibacter alkaliphilus HTCC2654]|nr:TRAP-type C4-dicarboxylate transport system substrate-binding protein [Maritimibacter alkaliphilus HTCC2654]
MRIINGVGLMAALTIGASAQAADVNVTYAAYGPPTSSNVEFGVIPFLETAKEMSEGTIDYTLHSGGSLLGAKAMLGGMKDGVIDGGQVLAVYYPAELPVSNLAMGLAPMLRSGGPALAAAITDYILTECPGCKSEMEANNMMFLGAYSTTSYSLLCTKPVDTLESLAGLKVRVPGDFAFLASHLGMTPVNMGIGETYEGLQRGALDCTLGPVGWLQQFSLGEVAKNVLDVSYGVSYGGPIISLTKSMWDGLDDTQKTAFQTGAAVGIFRAANGYIATDEEVLAGAEEAGYSIIEPGDALIAKLEDFNPFFNETLITRAKENGIEDAQGIVSGFRETLDMWIAAMEEIGDDEEAFVQKMMDEVYSDM